MLGRSRVRRVSVRVTLAFLNHTNLGNQRQRFYLSIAPYRDRKLEEEIMSWIAVARNNVARDSFTSAPSLRTHPPVKPPILRKDNS